MSLTRRSSPEINILHPYWPLPKSPDPRGCGIWMPGILLTRRRTDAAGSMPFTMRRSFTAGTAAIGDSHLLTVLISWYFSSILVTVTGWSVSWIDHLAADLAHPLGRAHHALRASACPRSLASVPSRNRQMRLPGATPALTRPRS